MCEQYEKILKDAFERGDVGAVALTRRDHGVGNITYEGCNVNIGQLAQFLHEQTEHSVVPVAAYDAKRAKAREVIDVIGPLVDGSRVADYYLRGAVDAACGLCDLPREDHRALVTLILLDATDPERRELAVDALASLMMAEKTSG